VIATAVEGGSCGEKEETVLEGLKGTGVLHEIT
jgi:hypothetical protein